MRCFVLLLCVGLLLDFSAGLPEISDLWQTILTKAKHELASLKRSLERLFSPVPTRPTYGDNVHLGWVRWPGSLPRWAVSVFNRLGNRTDYICSPAHRTEYVVGYYNPTLGPHCFTPSDKLDWSIGKEFDLLVNDHNLELLEWVSVEYFGYGEAPSNAVIVSHSSKADGYIFRGEEGVVSYLLFPPRKTTRRVRLRREEYRGDILTVNPGKYRERLSDVEYDMQQMQILSVETLRISKTIVANDDYSPPDRQVALTGQTELHGTWETISSKRLVISTSLTAQIPAIPSGITPTNSTPRGILGNSVSEVVNHTLSGTVFVPPQLSCEVWMTGTLHSVTIPFNASLQKTYECGAVHTATVPGIYSGTEVVGIELVIDSCQPM
ncbi:natterin-4-like [Clupea harengus]|uniref:Natterin-4-like n=1 Tax=Clupea harengus TaxID=7950 RepID=A0A6P3W5J5_CLUHA|nr:natterin-4-like [Clupea harengus]